MGAKQLALFLKINNNVLTANDARTTFVNAFKKYEDKFEELKNQGLKVEDRDKALNAGFRAPLLLALRGLDAPLQQLELDKKELEAFIKKKEHRIFKSAKSLPQAQKFLAGLDKMIQDYKQVKETSKHMST